MVDGWYHVDDGCEDLECAIFNHQRLLHLNFRLPGFVFLKVDGARNVELVSELELKSVRLLALEEVFELY